MPTNVNALNATELYTYKWLKWSILCYVYFTAIKEQNKPGIEGLRYYLVFSRLDGE